MATLLLALLPGEGAGAGPRSTAVGRPPTAEEVWVHSGEYADLRARYDVLWQQGWRLKVFDRHAAP